jgi:type IV pilus assembly protein PilE
MLPTPRRGVTLLEVALVCALAALLAAAAWPPARASWLRAGRGDAVEALTRLQMAQAQHHALHGLYASELSALRGVPQPFSTQGRYRVALDASDAEGWRASATALASGPQAGDHDCPQLTLEVRQGFASAGPSARCWNR